MVDFDTRRKGELAKGPESAGTPGLDTMTGTSVAETLDLLPDAIIDVAVRPSTWEITLDPARGYDSAEISQSLPKRIIYTGQNGEPSNVTPPSVSERDSDQVETTTVLDFNFGRLSRAYGEPSVN